MTEASGDCTCYRAPMGSGDPQPAAWVDMHERVAISTKDGRRVEGRPDGAVWFDSEDVWNLGLDVELDDGASFAVPTSDIASIATLVAPDPGAIIDAVTRALSDPLAVPRGGVWATAIVGQHHLLEVHVRVDRQPCMPSTRRRLGGA